MTTLLRNGLDASTVTAFTGHEDLATVLRYQARWEISLFNLGSAKSHGYNEFAFFISITGTPNAGRHTAAPNKVRPMTASQHLTFTYR